MTYVTASQVFKVEYEQHIMIKDLAHTEKDIDKEKAKEETCYVFTSDLEAVEVCPYLNASTLYYKTKLNIHNFTTYNLHTGHHVLLDSRNHC